jgi:hypothetical protein
MRQKEWADHWRGCYKGSPVEVTSEDEECLIAHEKEMEEKAKKFNEWCAERNKNRWR